MRSLSLSLSLAFAVAACSASPQDPTPAPATGSAKQAISGGADDSGHPFALGLRINGGGTCSAALIAPNLVLTARHCVSPVSTGGSIDATSVFTGNYPPNELEVTTSPDMGSGSFRAVREVVTPTNNKSQGNDVALLILQANVPPAEATPITPSVQHAIFNTKRYGSSVAGIGYGVTMTSGNDSGQRRIRQNIPITCIDGSRTPCDTVVDGNNARLLAVTEFMAGEGLCSGDSGSTAYEQQSLTAGAPISFGVASRVFSNGSSTNGAVCGQYVVYSRTDSHKDLIIATAKRAASLGGYAEPAWTTAVAPDPEDTPYVAPPKPPAATPKALGETCTVNKDCSSKLCLAPGDDKFVCTQACSDTKACPSGFSCDSNYCFKAAAPDPTSSSSGGAEPTPVSTTTTTSGCSTSPGSTGASAMWMGISALGLLLLRAGRRKAMQRRRVVN